MNPIESHLLEIVQQAETPLYSAYRWTGDELGQQVSLGGFLDVVDRMLQRELLQLWAIDPGTEVRDRLEAVPEGLEAAYRSSTDLDESFDPFGLSLTPGSGHGSDEIPEWEVELDFKQQVFELRAIPGTESRALEQLATLYPDMQFFERRRRMQGEQLHIFGDLRSVSGGTSG